MDNIIYIIPLAFLQIVLSVVAIVHILRHPNYKVGNKAIWIIVSCISFIGPILYFAIGKGDE